MQSIIKSFGLPAYSAGDLISNVNGEKYGANKAVQNKNKNQDILAIEVRKKLQQYPTILLAGHFCIFDKLNRVERLPDSVFRQISIERIILLEAEPKRILLNMKLRDNKRYEYEQVSALLKEK